LKTIEEIRQDIKTITQAKPWLDGLLPILNGICDIISRGRPSYEDERSLANERRVAERVATAWDLTLTKIPLHYYIDFAATRDGRVTIWVEIRCRSCSRNKYESFMLSLNKVRHAIQLSNDTGKPVVFVTEWTDGIFWIEMQESMLKLPLVIGGGAITRRNDWQDIEPLVLIPINDFRPLVKYPCHQRARGRGC
jgi:hypothetical protein